MFKAKKWRNLLIEPLKVGAALVLVMLLVSGVLYLAGGAALAQTPYPVQATWETEGAPTEGRVGQRLVISKLKLTNTGTQAWASSGPNEWRIGYRWFYGYGAVIPKSGANGYEELRASLPQEIPVNQVVVYPNFQVAVPTQPGDYVLHIDLVQPQQNDTFLQAKGVKDLEIKVSVKPRDTGIPAIKLNSLPLYSTSTVFNVSWGGTGDTGGYDVQYKLSGDNDWTNWLNATTLTSSLFRGENGKTYQFRVRGRDKAGNAADFPQTGMVFTRVDALPPSSSVDALAPTSPTAFLVRWSSFDNIDGPNTALFDVQYQEEDGTWTDWLSGTPGTAGLFQGKAAKNYGFRVRAQDYAGNRSEYSTAAQAKTTTSIALDSIYGAQQPDPVAPLPTGPTTITFPLATKNGDNNSGTTGFVITNPNNKPVDVFIRFNNFAGAPLTKKVEGNDVAVDANEATAVNRVVTQLETIPANSSKTIWAGNLYLPIYNGWAVVASSSYVQASAVRLNGDGKIIQYNAGEQGTKLYLPFVRKQEGNNSTIIAMANPGTAPAAVDITYYNEAGVVVFTEKRDLARLGSTRFTLSGIKTPDPNTKFTGSAIISSSVPLVATAENYLEDGSVATYTAQAKTADTISPTLVYKNVDGYTTSTVIQNTGDKEVKVKIEYLNDAGQVVASQDKTLAAFTRYVAWQGALQIESFKGKVRVTATGGNISAVTIGAGPGLKDKVFP